MPNRNELAEKKITEKSRRYVKLLITMLVTGLIWFSLFREEHLNVIFY